MQPSIPYIRGSPSVSDGGWERGKDGGIFSHNWCFVCQHTSPKQRPQPPPSLSLPYVGWANSGTEGGKCLRMLHSILCALNRRQSTTQVRLSEGDGCILVPSIEGGMGGILQQRDGIYGKWDPSTLNIIDLNMSSFVPSTLSRSRAPPLKEGSTSAYRDRSRARD